jgi:hypothetical protein
MTNNRVDQRARGLATATAAAVEYLGGVDRRPVAPDRTMRDGLAALGGPLPEGACDAAEVVRLLARHGSLGTVASAGPRYFSFVTGGTLPAALGAGVLAAAWD